MKPSREIQKAALDIAGALWGTVIVADPGWGEDIPEWVHEQIRAERLLKCFKNDETATDAECLAYLFTASLVAPMSHEASQIYFYLCGKSFEKRGVSLEGSGMDFPDHLEPDEQRELDQFKRWLYRARTAADKKKFTGVKISA